MKIIGYDKCPAWLKLKYRQTVNFICQSCHKPESEVGKLTPHRLLRGNQGGLYTLYPLNHQLNNVKIVCNACHKKLHGNEFSNVKSSKIQNKSIEEQLTI